MDKIYHFALNSTLVQQAYYFSHVLQAETKLLAARKGVDIAPCPPPKYATAYIDSPSLPYKCQETQINNIALYCRLFLTILLPCYLRLEYQALRTSSIIQRDIRSTGWPSHLPASK